MVAATAVATVAQDALRCVLLVMLRCLIFVSFVLRFMHDLLAAAAAPAPAAAATFFWVYEIGSFGCAVGQYSTGRRGT